MEKPLIYGAILTTSQPMWYQCEIDGIPEMMQRSLMMQRTLMMQRSLMMEFQKWWRPEDFQSQLWRPVLWLRRASRLN